jgi:hypothetical protein
MSEFEKQYNQFQLTAEQCDNLRRLADPRLYLPRTANRVIVETVIIENGERRVIKKEEQGAELV